MASLVFMLQARLGQISGRGTGVVSYRGLGRLASCIGGAHVSSISLQGR